MIWRKHYIYLMFTVSALGCIAQKKWEVNECSPDEIYLSLMKDAGVNTNQISRPKATCKVLYINSDSSFVRQYYSNKIYFEGAMKHGFKVGIWEGYYKSVKIAAVAYMGEPKNRPVFIELWDIKGKHISKTYMSIIE